MRSALLVSVVAVSCGMPPKVIAVRPAVSASALALECPSHGLRAYDGQRAPLPGAWMPCTVRVGNRGGSPLSGVKVSLLTEAGRFVAPEPSSMEGIISVKHQVALPLPLDVEPVRFSAPVSDALHTGTPIAPAWMHPDEWREDPIAEMTATQLEPRRVDPVRVTPDGGHPTNNPRDNLVSWIAVVDGEEAFTDANGNGAFDTNEPFVDLTEPFVDADDDGTRGPGELFVDTNANGRWDGANGVWDADTKIWASDRVLWTGILYREDLFRVINGIDGILLVPVEIRSAQLVDLRCASDPCGQATTTSSTTGFVYIADPWLNAMTHAEGDRCVVAESPSLVAVTGDRMRTQSTQLDWPAGERMTFSVIDARVPGMPTAISPSPVPFNVSVHCRYSNSSDGYWTELTFPVASGTIE